MQIFNSRVELIAVHVRRGSGWLSVQDQAPCPEKASGTDRASPPAEPDSHGQPASGSLVRGDISCRYIEGVQVLHSMLGLADRSLVEVVRRACTASFSSRQLAGFEAPLGGVATRRVSFSAMHGIQPLEDSSLLPRSLLTFPSGDPTTQAPATGITTRSGDGR